MNSKKRMWAMLLVMGGSAHRCQMLHMKRDGVRSKWPNDEFLNRMRAACRIRDRFRFDVDFWHEVSDYYAEAGVNTLLISTGYGVVYPSHPELAFEGGWSPEKLRDELERLRRMGFEVLPSLANFVFARKPGVDGEMLYRELKKRGVLVRHFSAPRIKDYLRITIGTDGEMDVLFENIKDILK